MAEQTFTVSDVEHLADKLDTMCEEFDEPEVLLLHAIFAGTGMAMAGNTEGEPEVSGFGGGVTLAGGGITLGSLPTGQSVLESFQWGVGTVASSPQTGGSSSAPSPWDLTRNKPG